jgi:CheY-like chemotaxis protein
MSKRFSALLLILVMGVFPIFASVSIAPWELYLTSIDDSSYSSSYWLTADSFSPVTSVPIPEDLGNGKYLMVQRSSFICESTEDLTIQISPTDHPYRLFVNGHSVVRYALTKSPYVASNYRSEMIELSSQELTLGKNSLLMVLYPRGERTAPPVLTIDNYENNSKRDFWQTFLNYTFVTGLSLNGFLIFLLFIAFWISSHREHREYLYFALTSLFISLGYLNVALSAPTHIEPPLWIIARSSFVAAAATLLKFTSIYAGFEKKFKHINRFFLFAALIFFINTLLMNNKYDIDRSFSTATLYLITPALLLTLGLAMKKLFTTRASGDVLIVAGISSTFICAFYDMYFFKNFKIPFFWTLAYGYVAMEMAILIALSKDLWKLYDANREKAELLAIKNEELNRQKNQLEEVSNGKSRFLRNMAHEFKTPLQGIVTIAELLQKQDESRDTVKTILHALNIQMQKHLYNIQNVMDLSVLEEQQPEINNKKFTLKQFLRMIELMFHNNEQNRKNSLKLSESGSLPATFYGDHEHISRITINLLTNMVSELKSTDILCNISWLEEESKLEITMGNGTGKINSRTLDILRNPREENLVEYNEESAIDDLAVFVAVRLIPVLNADLTIREADGEIVIRFPLELPAEKSGNGGQTGKILVAEDNPVNRMLISKILDKLGYSVLTAEDGLQAVERNREENPALIFMDVQMPVMDGIEATREIREQFPDVIIVALTANANKSECIDAGMNDFLNKPAHVEELKNVIDHYLAS